MIARTYSATLLGVDAHLIEVEVDVSKGLSAFNIVGLPDGTIRESRDRISAALSNSNFPLPVRRITVNLAPASLKKEGAAFDLPIALAVLAAFEVFPTNALESYLIAGELALDGSIRPIRGTLPMAIAAKEGGLEGLILPKENEAEAAVVEGLQRAPVNNLIEVVDFLQGNRSIHAQDYQTQELFEKQQQYPIDLQDVKGQEVVKRALEVAAAGNHNLLMTGPPGSGKTMIARRMPTILPPPSFEEALEITKIQSIAGTLPENTPLIATRPFRSPHHTISSAGLVGGGSTPRPGEVSLSHNGVLFLDELPEFPRNVLELLRQPLEDKHVVISRASHSLEFPCNFLMLASMNPCPCGFAGTQSGNGQNNECQCSLLQIQKYRSKISGPLLDRMDIQLNVAAVNYDELSDSRKGESSDAIRARVLRAHEFQAIRFQASSTRNNAGMSSKEIEQFATPSDAAQKLLQAALTKMGLSARAYDRILKVSRTIADLAHSQTIEVPHISEAIQYRSLDRPVSY